MRSPVPALELFGSLFIFRIRRPVSPCSVQNEKEEPLMSFRLLFSVFGFSGLLGIVLRVYRYK